jgi:hypothetical protein
MTPEKLAKLPKWAQEEFKMLETALAETARDRSAAYASISGVKTSHIYVDGYSLEPVGFAQGERKRLHIQRCWDRLVVYPSAANVIEIEERRD